MPGLLAPALERWLVETGMTGREDWEWGERESGAQFGTQEF